jgi:hypothetical protein
MGATAVPFSKSMEVIEMLPLEREVQATAERPGLKSTRPSRTCKAPPSLAALSGQIEPIRIQANVHHVHAERRLGEHDHHEWLALGHGSFAPSDPA